MKKNTILGEQTNSHDLKWFVVVDPSILKPPVFCLV